MPKKKDVKKPENLLPAAQEELKQKLQHLTLRAGNAQAFATAELILRGMKMQAVRVVAEHKEVLEIMGFKRLEDFFESLGLSARTGFNLKKIAEAFSDEETALLQSAGVSQRGILKLACLPPEQLPKLKDVKDPLEFKSLYEDALAHIEKQKEDADEHIEELKKEVGKHKRLMNEIVKERDELHSMLPTSPDGSWAEKPLTNIQEAFIRLDNLLSSFAFDPSIIGNDKLQAKVEGFRVEMEKRSVLFIERWEEHTGKKVGR